MNIEDAVLPDGVDASDVTKIESEAIAYAQRYGEDHGVREDTGVRQFNPQNGRWYSDNGAHAVNTTTVMAGVDVSCNYADCNGQTTVMTEAEIEDSCPDCGAPKMGRAQFGASSKKSSDRSSNQTRERHSRLADRTKGLKDDYSKEMNRLVEAGCGPTAAMDYIMCSIAKIPYEEWAEARDVDKQTVDRNIGRVAKNLGERVTYRTRP